MRILVIGGGGREHALAWRLAREDSVEIVHVAPGNAGTESAKIKNIEANSIDEWVEAAHGLKIDLTVVGPEQPLADGVVDRFKDRGLAILGPTAEAARVESSKSHAKSLMSSCGVATADHACVDTVEQAKGFISKYPPPYVVKADGLARGKATEFADDEQCALDLIADYLAGKYGQSSRKVVLERMLHGEEMSLTALCDGKRHILLPSCRDYKRLLDGDLGPNTGGMGAVSPAPVHANGAVDLDQVASQVITPMLDVLRSQGTPFCGFLYVGLMVTLEHGAVVLEYNSRLGDPEAQAILPRIQGRLAPILLAAANGDLSQAGHIQVSDEPAVSVVLCSKGYPDQPALGQVVRLPQARQSETLFHSNTVKDPSGAIVVNGGRVACATAWRPAPEKAREAAYRLAQEVSYDKRQYRSDIAGT